MKNTSALAALLATSALAASTLSGALIPIEDFDSAALGDSIGDLPGWTDNTDSNFSLLVATDPENASNQVLEVNVVQENRSLSGVGAYVDLPTAIPTSSTAATLFFRIRFDKFSTDDRAFAGFSAAADPDSFDDGAAYVGGITGGGGFGARDGGSTVTLGLAPLADTWYNVWLVANNSAQTYDVYINDDSILGASAGDLIADDFAFRNGADGIPGALDKILILGVNRDTENVYLDDFFVDASSANLANPIPEPSTLGMIVSALMVLPILLRLRRR